MLPVRILVVGNSIGLQRRLFDALDREGYAVSIGAGGPPPALTLARNCPDLLILEVGPALGRVASWRRAIASFRSRRPLAVLAIASESLDHDDRSSLESITDLGILVRPTSTTEIVQRLDEWYESETPIAEVN
jgi:DNA-binding response OmpR family regulator